MSVAPYTNNEKTTDGKPIFIVRTPNPISRKLLGVPFLEGTGRTTHEDRAKRFAEEFDYLVICPEGFKPWKFASKDRAEFAMSYDDDETEVITLAEDEE